MAERFVLPERPGNAGGGKGPQVRRGEGKREGRREWQCLGPRHCVRESWNHRMRKRREANAGTSASRGGRRGRQGVNRPAAGCGDRREEAGGRAAPATRTEGKKTDAPFPSEPDLPRCERHDPTGEPGAGKRHAGFGERGAETWLGERASEAPTDGESRRTTPKQLLPLC